MAASLVLSNTALGVVDTSNASVKCTSESSIHSDDGVSVGLHVLACVATTNASTAMV